MDHKKYKMQAQAPSEERPALLSLQHIIITYCHFMVVITVCFYSADK